MIAFHSSGGEDITSAASVPPIHQNISLNQQNNTSVQISNELTNETIASITRTVIETDLDHLNDISSGEKSDSGEAQGSSGEDYFTDLSYEATDQLNHSELIEKFKVQK